jgi:hypothetical protein
MSRLGEISRSHGGECEDDTLLGYGTKIMVAVSTSETSVKFSETKRRNIPEDCRLHKSRLSSMLLYTFCAIKQSLTQEVRKIHAL